jgi:hypothetical protein
MMRWKVEDLSGHGPCVSLSGTISEEADFTLLAAIGGPEPLRLDLCGVEQINSCGVREWIRFVRTLTQAARPFELHRCSPAMVRQLNTISNFRGPGAVRSVMLPYYCESCEREELRLLEIPEAGEVAPVKECLRCEKCGGTCEFDDIPNNYLAFAG